MVQLYGKGRNPLWGQAVFRRFSTPSAQCCGITSWWCAYFTRPYSWRDRYNTQWICWEPSTDDRIRRRIYSCWSRRCCILWAFGVSPALQRLRGTYAGCRFPGTCCHRIGCQASYSRRRWCYCHWPCDRKSAWTRYPSYHIRWKPHPRETYRSTIASNCGKA